MDRQNKMVKDALNLCKKKSIKWLIHIDCDEILDGDLNEILNLPKNVNTFWMQNYEAVYEDIPTTADSCFKAKYYRNCKKEKCASYINGKGGGRVSADIKITGPHRFESNGKEVELNMKVKHYESCDFNQYIKKYRHLSKGADLTKIPFSYYRESILASGSEEKLKEVFKQYRT